MDWKKSGVGIGSIDWYCPSAGLQPADNGPSPESLSHQGARVKQPKPPTGHQPQI
ncbi:MAG: hypothetical protein NZ901_11970 [Geminocystis sp.]|nr:hypothetical protein [Geminocystis sp.]HIK37487.1 hypothetical protein [Geminocystis sp. M7585_C2015_104]MCS7148887.1 hypothetical protein [Geminocystis sp.]MCX8078657.1 hypothetical protein [Geminocystis sp.]MDW8116972.1 hypothetical protein [Geminocystis sp.]